MAKYAVKKYVSVEATVVVIVDADSKEDAVDKAADLFSMNGSDAIQTDSGGWKASVTFKPPADVEVQHAKVPRKALYITAMSGPDEIKTAKLLKVGP